MTSIESFQTRDEKVFFLKNIISKLNISPSEKEIYLLCIDVLDESAFNNFFIKMFSQISEWNIRKQSIEPFTSTLI